MPSLPQSPDALVRRAALCSPRAEAVVDGAKRLTWKQVAERVSRLAGALTALGLGPGDTVGVIADNSLAVLELYFAAPTAGLVLLPLNTRLAGLELAECLDDARCHVVVAGPEYVDALREACPGTRIIAAGPGVPGLEHYDDLLRASPLAPFGLRADDVAYLYYTSGTTGRPKGVTLSAGGVLAGALGCAATAGLGSAARWLHASPMFHLADAWAIWAVTWLGGCHVTERFRAEATLRTLRRERIDWSILVPTALERLSAAAEAEHLDVAGMRGMLYGGAALPERTWNAAVAALRVPLIGTYGATETAGTITVLPWADQLPPSAGGIGRVGRETLVTTLTLIDDEGGPVGPGEVGEIAVSSPAVMLGYRNRPEETGAALAHGRYRTGDLGRREDDGVIRLVGRSKEMMISGGENVYPAEVENSLSLHPDVRAVAVFGVPDPEWGETVVAVVELEPGHMVDIGSLREFARQRLAAYKLPRALHVVDALPVTGSGKVDKALLRSRYQSNKID
jgi:acyl-CoA synthetase (AMP-forming)/AMP-acid ligase II